MNIKRLSTLTFFIFLMSVTAETMIRACTITLTNDTKDTTVLIALKNVKKVKNKKATTTVHSSQKITVAPGEATAFGDDTQHTCFDVYVAQQANRPTQTPNRTQKHTYQPTYNRLCTIAQHSCAMGKKIEVKVSEILRDRVNQSLFSVTPHQKRNK